jgi:Mitochondrial 39-S ribosomal protein L47 (MRP-L47)
MLVSIVRSFTKMIGSEVVPALFTDTTQEGKVSVGKSWTASLLRLKSNEDLHKLWYVLLREKNIILSDKQFAKQLRTPIDSKQRLLKVKISMARLLTVVREREIEKEKYWNALLDEYLKGHSPVETLPEKIEKKQKKIIEDNEEVLAKREKRKKAISSVKGWVKMNYKEKRSAIQKEYAKQAKIAKQEFLKELKYVGLKLREKGITTNTPNTLMK